MSGEKESCENLWSRRQEGSQDNQSPKKPKEKHKKVTDDMFCTRRKKKDMPCYTTVEKITMSLPLKKVRNCHQKKVGENLQLSKTLKGTKHSPRNVSTSDETNFMAPHNQ